MQNNFETDYQGKAVGVEFHQGNQPNEYIFKVYLPNGPMQLQCKKDNEGAYRWLKEDGSSSDETKEVGESIETYLMKNQITL